MQTERLFCLGVKIDQQQQHHQHHQLLLIISIISTVVIIIIITIIIIINYFSHPPLIQPSQRNAIDHPFLNPVPSYLTLAHQ